MLYFKVFDIETSLYFTNCIDIIDATHLNTLFPNSEMMVYTSSSESTTQNVLTECDFNMYFTFIIAK